MLELFENVFGKKKNYQSNARRNNDVTTPHSRYITCVRFESGARYHVAMQQADALLPRISPEFNIATHGRGMQGEIEAQMSV